MSSKSIIKTPATLRKVMASAFRKKKEKYTIKMNKGEDGDNTSAIVVSKSPKKRAK